MVISGRWWSGPLSTESLAAGPSFGPLSGVGRILGMGGGIATLLKRAEEKLDRSKADAFAKRPSPATAFPLEDFRDQLRQIIVPKGY
jgi:signal recognition particle GTPase